MRGAPMDEATERARARELRDQIVELSIQHETRRHAGAPCMGNRVGLAAFFMHSLGLRPGHCIELMAALAEYEEHHDATVVHVHDHPTI